MAKETSTPVPYWLSLRIGKFFNAIKIHNEIVAEDQERLEKSRKGR